jgi:hypothetical protein
LIVDILHHHRKLILLAILTFRQFRQRFAYFLLLFRVFLGENHGIN